MSSADESSDDENEAGIEEAGFEELQLEWLSRKDMEESLARAREPSTTASYVSASRNGASNHASNTEHMNR